TDQAVAADRTGMLGAGPNHGVFHDDPLAPDPDGATGLADEARAVQDAHARSDRDVAAQRRIRCHPRRRVDRWTLSRMFDQHRLVPARYHKPLANPDGFSSEIRRLSA